MSVDAAARALRWRADLQTVRILRYALGATLAMALAMGIDWRLSYLTPVLALALLAPPAPRLTLKTSVGLVGIISAASVVGVAIAALLLPYPEVFLLVEWLLLFLLFYGGARGAHSLLITMMLIAVTVIPVVSIQAVALGVEVAKGLVQGALAAVLTVWLAQLLLPDPPEPPSTEVLPAPPPPVGKPVLSRTRAASSAMANTLVVFPVVCLYLALGLTSVLVLVYIALLSLQPDLGAGAKEGRDLIAGNVMGGVAAVLVYEFLVMMPSFPFLLILTLLTGLFFGRRLFSEAQAARLFGMAYSTLLLVVGSTTSMFGDAGGKATTRVIEITTAAVYVVLAFSVLAHLRAKKVKTVAAA